MAEGDRVFITQAGSRSSQFLGLMKEWNNPTAELVAEAEAVAARTVFVAYPYHFPREEYRGAFTEIGEEFGVEFVYADEQITNKQILDKVTALIAASAFSIFDITTWNPNVSLELGIAIGVKEEYYIFFNPGHDETQGTVPTDLGGIDRVEYRDFTGLKHGLHRLMEQQFGAPGGEEEGGTGEDFNAQIDRMRERVHEIVKESPGIQMGGIAANLGVEIAYAQVIVRPLVDSSAIIVVGRRRGARYYLPEEVPTEPEEGDGSEGEVASAGILP